MLALHQHFAIALFALGLNGCNRSGREEQEVPTERQVPVRNPAVAAERSPPKEESGAAVVCDEPHQDAVRKELQDMCIWSGHLAAVDVPMSPWGGPPSVRTVDVQIAVARDEIRILPVGSGRWMIGEGNPLGEQTAIGLSDLAAALSTVPRRTNKDGDVQPPIWSLHIASDVPSSVVADVLRTLADANMLGGQIVLRNAEGPAPVRDPVLHAKLAVTRAEQAPGQRVEWAKRELARFAGPCLSFDDAIEAANSVEPSQSCWALVTGVAVALGDCGCEREAEVLTVMYTTVFGMEAPENRVAPVRATISPGAAPRRGKTWGSIVAQLEKKEDMLSLWVSGEE